MKMSKSVRCDNYLMMMMVALRRKKVELRQDTRTRLDKQYLSPHKVDFFTQHCCEHVTHC